MVIGEDLQIRLIALEYETSGYKVVTGEAPPQIPALENFSIDMYALRSDGNIIIEIANRKDRTPEELKERAEFFSEAMRDVSGWAISYRFFNETEEVFQRRTSVQATRAEVRDLLEARLMSRNLEDGRRRTQAALSDWWLWARGLRALSSIDERLRIDTSLSDLGEDIMSLGYVKRPYGYEYVKLYREIQSAFEGEIISYDAAKTMRILAVSLRKSLRSIEPTLPPGQDNRIVNKERIIIRKKRRLSKE